MAPDLIDIVTHKDAGYKPLVYFEGWRVAILNDNPESHRLEKLSFLERHMRTDEVFVLISGECTLLVAGNGSAPDEIEMVRMEPGKIYNIRQAVWHGTIGSESFSVLMLENADTSKQNTEYYPVTLGDQK